MIKVTKEDLNNYLVSIDGLINGHDKTPIVDVSYFSVGDGWFGILKLTIEELIVLGWNKEVTQVKEKFGGLRFYITELPQGGHDVINKYEKLSFQICELCGNDGTLHNNNGWYRTLCEEHKNK